MHRFVPDGAIWSRHRNRRAVVEIKGSRLLLDLSVCKLGSYTTEMLIIDKGGSVQANTGVNVFCRRESWHWENLHLVQ